MKENFHILECKKTSFRVQIQHQNARIILEDNGVTIHAWLGMESEDNL